MSDTTVSQKRTARKKALTKQEEEPKSSVLVTKSLKITTEDFTSLVDKILEAQREFADLQKAIHEIRESWVKEEKIHEQNILERDQQETILRKRAEEDYEYETALKRKRAEDEWLERKDRQEKELAQKKEEIEKDKQELAVLRKQVAMFEQEKEQVVKKAEEFLRNSLTGQYLQEKKLKEQEVKAEKDILELKIEGLTKENTRLLNEIAVLKKSFDETSQQVKEIALKVIESHGSQIKSSVNEE